MLIRILSRGLMLATLVALTMPGLAADLRDQVQVEIESVGLHPGMDPGMYVCASGHLHLRGTVANRSRVTLGRVTVAGKAFGPDGHLFGEATGAMKQPALAPNERAPIDLEFLTIGGPLIRQVKRHEVTVIEALPR
jgi:hypothetical protein